MAIHAVKKNAYNIQRIKAPVKFNAMQLFRPGNFTDYRASFPADKIFVIALFPSALIFVLFWEVLMMSKVPSFDDPDLTFVEWEDRPLAYKFSKLFLVASDKTLKPTRFTLLDIESNNDPISPEDALKLARRNETSAASKK
jgi:hypothetical protein